MKPETKILLTCAAFAALVCLIVTTCHHFATPPWTVVCDGKGHYQFTEQHGDLFDSAGVFSSKADAADYMERIKRIIAEPVNFDKQRDQVNAIKNWKVCTMSDAQPVAGKIAPYTAANADIWTAPAKRDIKGGTTVSNFTIANTTAHLTFAVQDASQVLTFTDGHDAWSVVPNEKRPPNPGYWPTGIDGAYRLDKIHLEFPREPHVEHRGDKWVVSFGPAKP